MKQYLKICSLFIVTAHLTINSFSQSSLYLSEGATFKITKGTSVFIDNLLLKPTADCNMKGLNSITRDATATALAPDTYIQRVYHLLKTQASYNGTISIYYKDAELNGLDENNLVLNIYNGTAWTPYSTNITRDATNNFVTVSGLSNISLNELTLTTYSALPISLSDFSAQNNNCIATLSWKTASEQNSKSFEVQLSADGMNFTTVGTVPASGNSSMEKQYNYKTELNNPTNYFRLQMVDLDGKSRYSSVVSVISNCSSNKIVVYPNPVNNVMNINGLSGTNQLSLLDEQGKVVFTIKSKNPSEKINTTHLPAGTYILQVVQNNNLIRNIKVIKE